MAVQQPIKNFCRRPCPKYTLLQLVSMTDNGALIWDKVSDKELEDALNAGPLDTRAWAFTAKDYLTPYSTVVFLK